MTKNVLLEAASIERIVAICKKVESLSVDNELTMSISEGIREWLENHHYLTAKQAKWVIHNATYHGLRLPHELAPFAAQSGAGEGRANRNLETLLLDIRDRLERIEDILKPRARGADRRITNGALPAQQRFRSRFD